jgi:RNA polymerase sigma-70 factor (ECF subfamily)
MTLASAVRGSWHQFLEAFEGLRPELYRYCRHLTRSPWDAEDLAQDVLARAFVTLGKLGTAPPNPRAWLFRVASNAWIDQQRRPRGVPERDPADTVDPRATREAAGTLIARLAPQERAAVVLKDVFDLPIEDIAQALSTTPNAVKAALHRGRGWARHTQRRPSRARQALSRGVRPPRWSSAMRSSQPPTWVSPMKICGTVRRPVIRIITSRCDGSWSMRTSSMCSTPRCLSNCLARWQ